MVLPVVLYGHPVLKKKATDIEANYPDLKEIIENMWETMYFAKGVGLAAPQIGLSIRLFIIDTMPYVERTTHVKINYFDENFVEHTEIFDEMNARVIQHEYDHIEGILFIEKINPLRRQLLQRKLEKLKKGIHSAKYPVRPM